VIGLSFSCILFVVFVVCYIVSKQYAKGTGGRLALEMSALGSMLLMVLSACVGVMGI
jgi:hypothetical protein